MSKYQFFNPFTKQYEGEILLKKNPMASSPNLIEYFLIMGYEETYIQERIIKNFTTQTQLDLELAEQKNKKLNPESKILNEYKCRNLPTILFSLGSNFSENLKEENLLIKDVFPIPPSVLYSIIDNFIYEPMTNDIVFSNIVNGVVNIGYAHIFYESKNILEKVRIYIPKAFVIISQYPFVNTYKSICIELLNQFKNKSIQIPLEIQLYNIINFIPAPINYDLSMTLFPSNELSHIILKCKSDKDLIHFGGQKEYILPQVSGYRDTQVDISVIFCILSSDIIIEIFIQILAGGTVAIFSSNISLLNMTIFIFQQMFYPLGDAESTESLSPLRYFYLEQLRQNIIGFACPYDELETFEEGNKTLCDEDEEEIDKFGNDFLLANEFILDLDKKKIEYLEEEEEDGKKEGKKNKKYKNLKIISDYVKKIIKKSQDKDSSTNFEKSLRFLYSNLNEIAFKLTYGNKNQVIPDYFVNENQFNRKIQNLFYDFMLNITHEFYQSIFNNKDASKHTRNECLKLKEETNLNAEEYLFFQSFCGSEFYRVLETFIGGYKENTLLIYDTPKLIFENLLNIKKLKEKGNISELPDNYFELIDEIYKKSNVTREISFLNFYKYYKENMAKDIYDSVNNKFVSAIKDKKNINNIKYTYQYSGINLDRNLILEYKYLIDSLPQKNIKHIFNLTFDNNSLINDNNNDNDSYDIYRQINSKITQRSIYNCIEQYFIRTKSIDYISVINFSILNIVALTTYKRTATPFILPIYDLFMKLPCSIRKYQEIIFSIAIRLIKTQNNKYNYQMFEKYFNLYEMCNQLDLFLNNQLIVLLNEINELKKNNKARSEEIIDKRFKDIENIPIEKLYSLESKKKQKDIIPILQMNISHKISSKLTFKSKYYNHNKKIEIKEQKSPIMIYNITNEMVDSYLQDLDFEKINKKEFEEIIIHLIYYTQILPDKFPQNLNKFLFYCFEVKKK